MRSVILNRTNIVPNTNNTTLVYNFPTSVDLTGARIAISNISMYYSWDNININYSNNRFSYRWRDGATTNTYSVVIPDGLYEVKDLNAYLQFVFIANKHYLVNSVGQNVYYAEFVVNPNRYAVQINTYPVPLSLPSGWSNPATMVFPDQSFNPEITLTANFNEILGYAAGFTTDLRLGAAAQNMSYLSSIAPQVQPNSTLLFALSGIDNKYATPNSIVYSLAPNVAIGELINEKPAEFNWNKLMAGTYSQLRLQILSNTFQPITIRDPQMTIVLVIEDQESKVTDVGAHLNMASSITAMTSRSGVPTNNNFNIGGSGIRR